MALLAARHVESDSFYRQALLAAAQMVKPDQAEGEQSRWIAFGRRADGGPSGLAAAKEGAGIAGGQAGFEVGIGADFGQRSAFPQQSRQLQRASSRAAWLRRRSHGHLPVRLHHAAGARKQILDKLRRFFREPFRIRLRHHDVQHVANGGLSVIWKFSADHRLICGLRPVPIRDLLDGNSVPLL